MYREIQNPPDLSVGRKSYKYLIDDRMKAFDLNEQVLLKRRITIIHADDVKALDIAHDCG